MKRIVIGILCGILMSCTDPAEVAREAQQKMQEALKNMSPEQREMIEKMMKQRPAPKQ